MRPPALIVLSLLLAAEALAVRPAAAENEAGAPLPAVRGAPSADSADREYAIGLAALRAQRYREAVVHLSAAILSGTLAPRRLSDAHYFRGRGLTRLSKPELALIEYSRAIDYWPENVKALRLRCRALTIAGELEKAEPDCDRAVLFAPDDWRSWFTRGLLRDKVGQRDLARSDLSAALFRMPDGMTDFPIVKGPMRAYDLIEGGWEPAPPNPHREDGG